MTIGDLDHLRVDKHPYAKGCQDCDSNPTCPMLVDDTWLKIGPKNVVSCFECAEKRLGRQIALEDLMPCIGNYGAFVLIRRVQ